MDEPFEPKPGIFSRAFVFTAFLLLFICCMAALAAVALFMFAALLFDDTGVPPTQIVQAFSIPAGFVLLLAALAAWVAIKTSRRQHPVLKTLLLLTLGALCAAVAFHFL